MFNLCLSYFITTVLGGYFAYGEVLLLNMLTNWAWEMRPSMSCETVCPKIVGILKGSIFLHFYCQTIILERSISYVFSHKLLLFDRRLLRFHKKEPIETKFVFQFLDSGKSCKYLLSTLNHDWNLPLPVERFLEKMPFWLYKVAKSCYIICFAPIKFIHPVSY